MRRLIWVYTVCFMLPYLSCKSSDTSFDHSHTRNLCLDTQIILKIECVHWYVLRLLSEWKQCTLIRRRRMLVSLWTRPLTQLGHSVLNLSKLNNWATQRLVTFSSSKSRVNAHLDAPSDWRSRVQPPPRSATFCRGDWSWNIFFGHSLPSADSRRAVVSFWRKNVHNTG